MQQPVKEQTNQDENTQPKMPRWKKILRISFLTACWSPALTYVAAALATYAFPRAEDVLKREGLAPEIAQQLAPGMRIYVREDNFLGRAHAMLDSGLFGIFRQQRNLISNDSVGGYAMRGTFHDRSVCRVYLKRDVILRTVDEERYVANPLSAREQWQQIVLHELRHCGQNFNGSAGELTIEGDADYRSTEALVQATGDASLRQRVLDNRALGMSHDTALYLDAKFRGVTPPTEADIQRERRVMDELRLESNRQADEQIAEYQKTHTGMCMPVVRLNFKIERPLTARRLMLRFDAMSRLERTEAAQEQRTAAANPAQAPKPPLPLCVSVS